MLSGELCHAPLCAWLLRCWPLTFAACPCPPLPLRVPPAPAGENCYLRRCVVDENACIGNNVQVINKNGVREADRAADSECGQWWVVVLVWRGVLVGASGVEVLAVMLWPVLFALAVRGRAHGRRCLHHAACHHHSAAPAPACCYLLPTPAYPIALHPPRLSAAGGFMIQDGIVVVMRNAVIPDGIVI